MFTTNKNRRNFRIQFADENIFVKYMFTIKYKFIWYFMSFLYASIASSRNYSYALSLKINSYFLDTLLLSKRNYDILLDRIFLSWDILLIRTELKSCLSTSESLLALADNIFLFQSYTWTYMNRNTRTATQFL